MHQLQILAGPESFPRNMVAMYSLKLLRPVCWSRIPMMKDFHAAKWKFENWSPTFSDSPKKSIFPSSFLYQNSRNHIHITRKMILRQTSARHFTEQNLCFEPQLWRFPNDIAWHFPGSATISIPGFVHCWDLWWTSPEKKNAPKLHVIFPNLGMSCRKKNTQHRDATWQRRYGPKAQMANSRAETGIQASMLTLPKIQRITQHLRDMFCGNVENATKKTNTKNENFIAKIQCNTHEGLENHVCFFSKMCLHHLPLEVEYHLSCFQNCTCRHCHFHDLGQQSFRRWKRRSGFGGCGCTKDNDST